MNDSTYNSRYINNALILELVSLSLRLIVTYSNRHVKVSKMITVASVGFEPTTQGFSILCSTNWSYDAIYTLYYYLVNMSIIFLSVTPNIAIQFHTENVPYW